MPRFEALLVLVTIVGLAGCENPQTVTESKTQTAPAVKQASQPAEKAPPKDLTETESGLKYKIVREGEGDKARLGSQVVAHYEGWLEDGTIFDSSYDRGEPFEFSLQSSPGGVIEGWVEGIQLIREGGEIRLVIPGPLAYPEGRPGIPPGATLNFKVELVEVK